MTDQEFKELVTGDTEVDIAPLDWWRTGGALADGSRPARALAYYRYSRDGSQENSIPIQMQNVREFSKKHRIEIIDEFEDPGRSGLNAEGREGFTKMMEVVRTRDDFDYILVLDITRWGRFQDVDLSAHYEYQCKEHGKQVIYTDMGLPTADNPMMYQFMKTFGRVQAAEFSATLSKKVFRGSIETAEQGYRLGGPAPYGTHRLMLDRDKKPDRVLYRGDEKGLANGRVVLIPGDKDQVGVVREIFHLFVEKREHEREIAARLNARGVPSPYAILWKAGRLKKPRGLRWSEGTIRHILKNQQYAGAVVYNKTYQQLKAKRRTNPLEDWVIVPGAHEAIIDPETFEQARAIFEARKRRYDREAMLAKLKQIYEEYGVITSQLLRAQDDCPAPATYAHRFGGMQSALQSTFKDVLQRAKDEVFGAIKDLAGTVVEYDNFLVINGILSVLIQPSVPVPHGYSAHWTFKPDQRAVIDITLGVPLSGEDTQEILGYLVLPRLLMPSRWVRLSSSSDERIAMHGHPGLNLIRELLN